MITLREIRRNEFFVPKLHNLLVTIQSQCKTIKRDPSIKDLGSDTKNTDMREVKEPTMSVKIFLIPNAMKKERVILILKSENVNSEGFSYDLNS